MARPLKVGLESQVKIVGTSIKEEVVKETGIDEGKVIQFSPEGLFVKVELKECLTHVWVPLTDVRAMP